MNLITSRRILSLMVGNFNDENLQKQPFTGVLGKRSSENMQQIYRKTPMSKYDFNKVALLLY